jgi:outer membrane protein OmpA-like peptidoglycan-associated protein
MSGIEETGKKAAKKVASVAADGVDAAKNVVGDAANAAGDAAEAGLDAAKGALGAVGGMLGGIAGKAGKAAGAAADAAKGAVAGVADKAGDLAEGAVDAAKGAAGKVGDVVGNVADKAGDLADGAMDAAKGAAGAVGDVVGNVADKAGDLADGAMDAAKGAVGAVGDAVGDLADGIGDAAKGAMGAVGNVAGGAADMAGNAAGKIGGAGVAALGAGAAVLGGAATGIGNMGKGAVDGVSGAVGFGGGSGDEPEKKGGGFLMPLLAVLGLGALAYFGWQALSNRTPAPAAVEAPAAAALPAWLTSIGDTLKAKFVWLNLGVNGSNVIASGEAADEASKLAALKELTLAVKAAPEGAASLIIDNITVTGSTATPVGAALAALGANPDAAACNTAFSATMAGRTINFSTGGASIGADNASLLDTLTAVATACKAHKVEVAGHTDSVGKPESNQALSQKRADAVKAYWVAKGVAAEGLVAKGYGETKPVEAVADETENAKNRRIDFAVTDSAAVAAPVEPAK